MAKQRIKPVQGRKVGKKVEKEPVVETEPVKQDEIQILPNTDSKAQKKAKLEAELKIRAVKVYELAFAFFKRAESDSGLPTLSDCEKMLSASFDCRNSARKLEKLENNIIIA